MHHYRCVYAIKGGKYGVTIEQVEHLPNDSTPVRHSYEDVWTCTFYVQANGLDAAYSEFKKTRQILLHTKGFGPYG